MIYETVLILNLSLVMISNRLPLYLCFVSYNLSILKKDRIYFTPLAKERKWSTIVYVTKFSFIFTCLSNAANLNIPISLLRVGSVWKSTSNVNSLKINLCITVNFQQIINYFKYINVKLRFIWIICVNSNGFRLDV